MIKVSSPRRHKNLKHLMNLLTFPKTKADRIVKTDKSMVSVRQFNISPSVSDKMRNRKCKDTEDIILST